MQRSITNIVSHRSVFNILCCIFQLYRHLFGGIIGKILKNYTKINKNNNRQVLWELRNRIIDNFMGTPYPKLTYHSHFKASKNFYSIFFGIISLLTSNQTPLVHIILCVHAPPAHLFPTNPTIYYYILVGCSTRWSLSFGNPYMVAVKFQ